VLDIIIANTKFLKQAIAQCTHITLLDTTIPVILLDDLIIITLAAGRTHDILDVEALLATNLPMNREYIQSHLAKLHIASDQKIMNIILQ